MIGLDSAPMRPAKVHPVFIVLMLLAFLGPPIGFAMTVAAADSCDNFGPQSHPFAGVACEREGQALETGALVLALGGLTTMVAAVGFQVTRAGVRFDGTAPLPPAVPGAGGPGHAVPGQGVPPQVPPGVPGGYAPGYPPPAHPTSGAGQPPYA